jgi:hypothetical protein
VTTTSDPQDTQAWEAIIRTWGHAHTFSHNPDDHPDQPYAARRKDGNGTLRAPPRTPARRHQRRHPNPPPHPGHRHPQRHRERACGLTTGTSTSQRK